MADFGSVFNESEVEQATRIVPAKNQHGIIQPIVDPMAMSHAQLMMMSQGMMAQGMLSHIPQPIIIQQPMYSPSQGSHVDEVRALRQELVAAMNKKDTPVIIHNNVTTAVDNKTVDPEKVNDIRPWYEKIWKSKFNRVMILSGSALALYMVQAYLRHKWHMESVQKQIDSSLPLKLSQKLSTLIDGNTVPRRTTSMFGMI